MSVFVRLLGTAQVSTGPVTYELEPGRRAAVLLFLAYRKDWVTRDELLYLFWPDAEEHRARTNLRQVVRSLKAFPYTTELEVERTRLRWLVRTDLDDPGSTGLLLQGFRLPDAAAFEDWLDLERASLQEAARRGVLHEAELAVEDGRSDDALRALQNWLLQYPVDEEVVHRVMLLCRTTGQASTGLRHYELFKKRLARELGLDPSPAVMAAHGELIASQGRSGNAASGQEEKERGYMGVQARWAGTAWRATVPRSSFVGRESELATVCGELSGDDTAVVQLIGPGGMGKTRLALEIAGRLESFFGGDIVHVPLVGVHAPEEAVAVLAQAAAGEAGAAVGPVKRAVAALSERRPLIVLDNLEQIPGFEAVLEQLEAELPLARWLLTSRRRLALARSVAFELDGLVGASADDGVAGSASQLFLERAREHGANVELGRDGAAVEELVEALGGMPLAIELAATWSSLLSPAQLLERFGREAGLPVARSAGPDARHTTVERALLPSWQMLSASQRQALARLTVFEGGCTVQAAAAVAGVRLRMLSALRDASMLRVTPTGRVTQHPLIETFTRERAVAEEWDLRDVRAAHASYYLRFAKQQEDLGQAGSDEAIELLQAEHGNIERAWAHALEGGNWRALMQAGGAMLGLSYAYAGDINGRWVHMLESVLERAPPTGLEWAVLMAHVGSTRLFDGRIDQAYHELSSALEVAQQHDDPFYVAWVYFHYSNAARASGDMQAGLWALETADKLLASIGEVHVRSMVTNRLYAFATTREEREARYRANEEIWKQAGSPEARIEAWSTRARDLAFLDGDFRAGLGMIDAAVALERTTRWNALDLPERLRLAAQIRLCIGDLARTRLMLEEALVVGRPYSDTYLDHGATVCLLARAHWLLGDLEAARAILDGADAALQPVGVGTLELEAEIALAAGDVLGARQSLAAAAGLRGTDLGRFHRLDQVGASLIEARVLLAAGLKAEAHDLLLAVLATVVELGFVPASLELMTVAADLLPEAVAARARTLVSRHPGTTYEVRQRSGLQGGRVATSVEGRSALDVKRLELLEELPRLLVQSFR